MANRRWQCPNGEHPAVNAPEKGMRLDDIRRFCLSCSEETGRLVKRVCVAAEKARARRQEKTKKKQAKKRAKAITKRRATVGTRRTNRDLVKQKREHMRMCLRREEKLIGTDYRLSGIDLHAQLDHLLTLDMVPRALKVLKPKLHIRQCEKTPQRWGFAKFRDGRGYLSVSIWPGIGPGEMLAHLCHELAHLVAWHECVARTPHGPDWRQAYKDLVQKGYNVYMATPAGRHRCDLDDVAAFALSATGRALMRKSIEEAS